MWDILFSLAAVVLLAVAVIVAIFLARAYQSGIAPRDAMSSILAPKAPKRISIVETASIDGRRRLVLIRRDNVEHLIMTGGPVDLVIETGIEPREHKPA